jgi:transposase-like protein
VTGTHEETDRIGGLNLRRAAGTRCCVAVTKTTTRDEYAAICTALSDDLNGRNAWGDETEPAFQEYVAREHLQGGMPVVELHRNHGIPLSAVKRWIATFQAEGRAGLDAAAQSAAEKAQKRTQALLAKKPSPEEIAALTFMIEGTDIGTKREAYATIGKRLLVALVPAIVKAIERTKSGYSIQDELELLALLRAKDALLSLQASKLPIINGYRKWFPSLLHKAGKP